MSKGVSIPREEGFAYWIAGIRELFEEAGILFAYNSNNSNSNGEIISMDSPGVRHRFQHYRDLLLKGQTTLINIMREERLVLALDQLHHYAHWITPVARAIRFDTHFFLARYPAGQEAAFDHREATDSVWIAPEKALKKNVDGTVILSPPTLKTLEELSQFQTIDELLASSQGKDVSAILPILTDVSGETLIIFPWDEEYEKFKTGEAIRHTNYVRPSACPDKTTRLIMKKGRWLPYIKTVNNE